MDLLPLWRMQVSFVESVLVRKKEEDLPEKIAEDKKIIWLNCYTKGRKKLRSRRCKVWRMEEEVPLLWWVCKV